MLKSETVPTTLPVKLPVTFPVRFEVTVLNVTSSVGLTLCPIENVPPVKETPVPAAKAAWTLASE